MPVFAPRRNTSLADRDCNRMWGWRIHLGETAEVVGGVERDPRFESATTGSRGEACNPSTSPPDPSITEPGTPMELPTC